jgi:ABC-type nitrate/sulfonate/bicarbonate transport system substrate-binding protein
MRVFRQSAAFCAAIVFSVGTAQAADKIHLGKAQGAAWAFITADIGVEEGFFAKNGLDVEIVNLAGDAKVQQALAAGSIDFGLGSGPGMAFAVKGSPGIGVAAFAGAPRSIAAIVNADAPIKTVADLKGKMIAVSTVGSLSEWLAKQMAVQEGWGPDGIKTVPLGAIDASIAAMKAKQVDAVVLATEAGYALEEKKDGRIVTGMATYAPHFITHVVFAQKEIIAKNPAQVERFLKGFFASIAFLKANKEKTSAIAEKVLRQSPTVARRTYDAEMPMFSTDGTFDPEAVETLKRSFVEMGTLDKAPANDALFTTQFVPVKP